VPSFWSPTSHRAPLPFSPSTMSLSGAVVSSLDGVIKCRRWFLRLGPRPLSSSAAIAPLGSSAAVLASSRSNCHCDFWNAIEHRRRSSGLKSSPSPRLQAWLFLNSSQLGVLGSARAFVGLRWLGLALHDQLRSDSVLLDLLSRLSSTTEVL
jgi:hypothetical protein